MNTEPALDDLQGLDPEAAFEASEYDFTAFLAYRLGVPRARAESVLGQWLVQYEPIESRRARETIVERGLEGSPASGLWQTPGVAHHRSGTDG